MECPSRSHLMNFSMYEHVCEICVESVFVHNVIMLL